MSNSPLVNYTKISPNKSSPRNHKIDTVTIHCVVGQCSVETLGNVFAPTSRQASSNYGIGYDGRIGMYVEEKDRSWCSSNAANDNRAVTIEVASDTKEPYAVTDKAYAALIDLLVDICKRNGIKELKWKADKSLIGQPDKQNMTVDCYVLWSVSDPLKFYQSLGNTSVAEERLNALTYNALKTVMGTLSQSNIINMDDGAARNDIYEGITTSVDTLAANYGIKVEDVKIKRFDLPEANESAVYARMISERQQIAEKYTADGNYEASLIRNDVDKQVNIIVSNAEAEAAKLQAEGEAEYMRLLGKAYNTEDKQEFYKFTQALEALKSTLNGDEKTIILGKDSDLAQILTNP